MTVRFRRRPSLKVHLRRVFDGKNLVVLHDHVRRICVVDRAAHHVGMAVDGFVHGLRAEREGPWYGLGSIANRNHIPGAAYIGALTGYWTSAARLDWLE